MNCPKCGSNNVQIVTEKVTTENGFNGCLACIGVLLFQWIGLLCGLCGRTTEQRTTTRFICKDCGYRF